MRAAHEFATGLARQPNRILITLFGSLAHTGKGHGTDKAILAGLAGEIPEAVDPALLPILLEKVKKDLSLPFKGHNPIHFNLKEDLLFDRKTTLPFHPNAIRFLAIDADGMEISKQTYFSIGGGFIISEMQLDDSDPIHLSKKVTYPFHDGRSLFSLCESLNCSPSQIVLCNEDAFRPREDTDQRLDRIWKSMQTSILNGTKSTGILPGGLKVSRRAPALRIKLESEALEKTDPMAAMDWVNLYAIAVNEENASGGRVVTAPTNGAAGVIPAVMQFCQTFMTPKLTKGWSNRFLATAGAIGLIFKENASISGADVGCQGEVGVACSMAAGAMAEFLGGTPSQIENAAEIGMEHNLGLTCDPIGGLVQIPCIERNAMAAVKAINAARMAIRGDGKHLVSLDTVVQTMKSTGKDMKKKYKETSRGGLAVNYVEC